MWTRFARQAWAESKSFFFGSKLNVLLVTIPLATISRLTGWSDGWTCVLAMIALCPAAERLGFVTEELASYTNDSIGGLLNATFGNATELIVSIFALRSHLIRVVQLSLLGSVISNLLVVMGTAFLAGGLTRKTQTFSSGTVSVPCCLLLLACVAVLLPTLLVAGGTEASSMPSRSGLPPSSTLPDQPPSPPPGLLRSSKGSSLTFSRIESILMLASYLAFLVFQLYTHKHLFEEDEEKRSEKEVEVEEERAGLLASSTHPDNSNHGTLEDLQRKSKRISTSGVITNDPQDKSLSTISRNSRNVKKKAEAYNRESAMELSALPASSLATQSQGLIRPSDEESGIDPTGEVQGSIQGEEDGPQLSWPGALFWITMVTVVISVLSQWIVDAIEGASKDLKIPLPFIATILLPLVGNAAEHASAVIFAVRNRVELALGICVGSSTQVAMMLLPFAVLLAWMMGEDMSLDLGTFEAGVLVSTVILASIMLADGSCNWLKGLVLLMCYGFTGAGFWFHGDLVLDAESNKQQT